MKVEFFPAAATELLEAAREYEALLSGLGSDFLVEVDRLTSVLVELPSLGEKLDSIHRRIHCAAFHMHSSSAATAMSSVSSRWRIEDADRGTGSLVSKIAKQIVRADARGSTMAFRRRSNAVAF